MICVFMFTLLHWYKTQITIVNNYMIRANNVAPVIRLDLSHYYANTIADEAYQMTMGAIKLWNL